MAEGGQAPVENAPDVDVNAVGDRGVAHIDAALPDSQLSLREAISNATTFLRPALEKDRQKEFSVALKLYTKGLEVLLSALQMPGISERIKTTLQKKINDFMTRAEHVKGHVQGMKCGLCKLCSARDSEECSLSIMLDEETLKQRNYLMGFMRDPNIKVKFDEVKGQSEAKDALKENVCLPLLFPDLFARRSSSLMVTLLYGHAGTGKTMLLSAAANECPAATIFHLSVWDFATKYVEDCERMVKELFVLAAEKRPSVIYLEDIEAVEYGFGLEECCRKFRAELLVQLHQCMVRKEGMFHVVFSCQRPWTLSPIIRRRVTRKVHVTLPNKEARIEIIKSHMAQTKHSLSQRDFEELGDKTYCVRSGICSQADISVLCRDVMMQVVRKVQQAEYFKQVHSSDSESNPRATAPITDRDGHLSDTNPSHDGQEGTNAEESMQTCAGRSELKGDTDVQSSGQPSVVKRQWTPCRAEDEGAVKMSWLDVDVQELVEPPVEMEDFLKCLEKFSGTVSHDDNNQMNNWIE